METNTHVFFYGDKPNKISVHIFSQWYPIPFTEYFGNDLETKLDYCSTEQYMMAHKALLFGDALNYEKIMNTTNPAAIKKYGRLIKGFDPDTWDDCKLDIVTKGNRLKFNQNAPLLSRLMETGNKILVEASPYDAIWGIGLSANQAISMHPSQWPGSNLLGQALMTVRDEHIKL